MRLNPIKRHHLIYALKRSLDPIVIGVIFFAMMAAFGQLTLEGFLYASIPFIVASLAYFAFHLWKVLKDR